MQTVNGRKLVGSVFGSNNIIYLSPIYVGLRIRGLKVRVLPAVPLKYLEIIRETSFLALEAYCLNLAHLCTKMHRYDHSTGRKSGRKWLQTNIQNIHLIVAKFQSKFQWRPVLFRLTQISNILNNIKKIRGDFMARHINGWVKLWRKAALGDINSNFTRGGLFSAMISMANIQTSTVDWRGGPLKLQRGQIVTSLKELAELGGIDKKTVSRHLNYLKRRETINVESSSTGTLITLINYEQYCGHDAEGSTPSPHDMDQGRDHDRHAIGVHSKELKNKRIKEVKNTIVDLKSTGPHWLALIWNDHCGALARIRLPLTNARQSKVRLRIKEFPNKNEWLEAVIAIKESDFCNARVSNSSWLATFDWLIKPGNLSKVLEGNYKNREGQNSQASEPFKINFNRTKESEGA